MQPLEDLGDAWLPGEDGVQHQAVPDCKVEVVRGPRPLGQQLPELTGAKAAVAQHPLQGRGDHDRLALPRRPGGVGVFDGRDLGNGADDLQR